MNYFVGGENIGINKIYYFTLNNLFVFVFQGASNTSLVCNQSMLINSKVTITID